MNLHVVFVILTLVILANADGFNCPFPEDLLNCKCYPASQRLVCIGGSVLPDLKEYAPLKFNLITINDTDGQHITLSSDNANKITTDVLILANNKQGFASNQNSLH